MDEMMEKTKINLTLEDFPFICRICLSKLNLKPFYQFSHLVNLFENITNIQINFEVGLPNNVCTSCIEQLEKISWFIDESKANDINLGQILTESKLKVFAEEFSSDSSTADCQPQTYISQQCNNIDINLKRKDTHNFEKINDDLVPQVKLNRERKQNEKSFKRTIKSKLVNCAVCGDQFDKKNQLIEHQKKSSECNVKQFKCIHCEKSFLTKFKLKLHMRSHTKESPFQCNICSKKFRHSSNLKRHDDTVHKGLKPFKCEICGKEYSRLATKNEHMYSHTGEHPYTCTYCGKSFRTYSSRFYHMYSHKSKNGENKKSIAKKNVTQISELGCKICNKFFSSKSGVLQHLMLHGERKFLCSNCGKSFIRKQQLEDHSRLHSGEKPHVCKHCGKSFRQLSGYKTHVLIHTGEKPHQCKICRKSFIQSIHLRKHMRTHTGEKPYECSFCGKCFAEKCNLKVHTRTHTGETPYRCSVCDMDFIDSRNMKKHEKGHLLIKNKIIKS